MILRLFSYKIQEENIPVRVVSSNICPRKGDCMVLHSENDEEPITIKVKKVVYHCTKDNTIEDVVDILYDKQMIYGYDPLYAI